MIQASKKKRYLLDNNAFSGITKDNPALLKRLSVVPPEAVFLSIVAVREAIRGIAEVIGVNEKQGAKGLPGAYVHLFALVAALDNFVIYPYTQEADDLYKSWSGKGSGPGQNDWRIAASAVSAGMILVTADRHFAKIQQFVPELLIEDWSFTEGTAE